MPRLMPVIKKKNIMDEQLDMICMRLENDEQNAQVIMVASPSAERSRVIVTCNLAKALAHRGKKVLLIDANFEDPFLHKWFRTKSELGLSEFLITGNAAQLYEKTEVEGLMVIPAGKESGLAGRRLSENYKEEFENWKKEYDLVIFQAPPAKSSSPLSIITKACDSVIVIVKENKDKKQAIKALIEDYRKVGKKIIGLIYQKEK